MQLVAVHTTDMVHPRTIITVPPQVTSLTRPSLFFAFYIKSWGHGYTCTLTHTHTHTWTYTHNTGCAYYVHTSLHTDLCSQCFVHYYYNSRLARWKGVLDLAHMTDMNKNTLRDPNSSYHVTSGAPVSHSERIFSLPGSISAALRRLEGLQCSDTNRH